MTPGTNKFVLETIPADFARRARSHVEGTGEPLLEYRASAYPVRLIAERGYSGYDFVLADWSPPFSTWREYAEYVGESLETLLEERELTMANADRRLGLDELPEFWDQMVRPYDTDLGGAYMALQGLPFPSRFTAQDTGENLGSIEFVDGAYPGSDYVGVSANSALAVSCLQYMLDACDAGIKVSLAEGHSTTATA